MHLAGAAPPSIITSTTAAPPPRRAAATTITIVILTSARYLHPRQSIRIGQSIGQNPPLCVANRLTIETYGGMLSANIRFVARISAAQFPG
jgi:hypothetical protein